MGINLKAVPHKVKSKSLGSQKICYLSKRENYKISS